MFICLVQSWGYVKCYLLGDNGRLLDPNFYDPVTQTVPFGWIVVTMLTMTAGTIFLMWLGEQIDEFGIGNGISLLIMAGILARMPAAATEMLGQTQLELGSGSGKKGIEVLIGLVLLFVGVVAAWSSISPRPSAASRRSTPSTCAAAASSAARGNICRCGSIRPASCRSSSPAAC